MAKAGRDTIDLMDSLGQTVTLPRKLVVAHCELAQAADPDAALLELRGTRFDAKELDLITKWLTEALKKEGPEDLDKESDQRAAVLFQALLDLGAREAVKHLTSALGMRRAEH